MTASPNLSPAIESAAPALSEIDEKELLKLRLLTPDMLDAVCREDRATEYVVDGIIPRRAVGILTGDSGLGKTPLIYLVALCKAAGLPFAGHNTKQGRVLYYEMENPSHASRRLRNALVQFLKLDAPPAHFLEKLERPDGLEGLEKEIELAKPELVILDTLREFSPEATENNKIASAMIQKLRAIARKYGCTILVIHHVRKPSRDGKPTLHLKDTSVLTWLLEMEGARAWVNHTDFRIAVEEGDGTPAALNVRWNRKTLGDSPLVQFERVFDDEGEPIGYQAISGAEMLGPKWHDGFNKLPADFHFKDVMDAVNCKQGEAGRFLKSCDEYKLIEKVERGHYRKISGPGADKADIHAK